MPPTTPLVLPSLAAIATPAFPLNWTGGWTLVLLAFLSGAVLGLGWHRDDFLGGYASFRRRVVRLGHIAFAALGMLNIIFSIVALPPPGTTAARVAATCLLAGGITMPLTCFMVGWRPAWRHAFALPVTLLVVAVVSILLGAHL
jgi:hypothetical protein